MKSPNAKRTAARKRATREMRWQLCLEVGKCEVCGRIRGAQNLVVHEIARGTSRQEALDKRYAVLVVCSLICHDKVQVEPLVKQLARLYMNRQADYDRVSFNRLRRRADDAISQAEVDVAIRQLLEVA